MRQSTLFEPIHRNITKFQTKLNNFIPPPKNSTAESEKEKKFAVFARKYVDENPKQCTWTYMREKELVNLLSLTNKCDVRAVLDEKMGDDWPKGFSRLLALELLCSALQFCRRSKLSIAQTGTLLSIFYLTHQYFLSSFDTSTEKTYRYFKEHILYHCVDCPPDTMQVFNYAESKGVVLFFCTLYLRNLPLIKLLTLPNFGFTVDYELEPEPVLPVKGKKK